MGSLPVEKKNKQTNKQNKTKQKQKKYIYIYIQLNCPHRIQSRYNSDKVSRYFFFLVQPQVQGMCSLLLMVYK